MTRPTEIWIDVQLPPVLAGWIAETFAVPSRHLIELGLERTPDHEVFRLARAANAAILSKDADFATMVRFQGPPPSVFWLRCGNAPTSVMKAVVQPALLAAMDLAEQGEGLIEIL
jgi:predicted nuclease of predicted toxin-antitoxin system